jgi:hypothetical protein
VLDALLADFTGEYRAEPVPPQPHRFMADVDAALEQQILDVAQRKRIANVHHHHQADHLGRAVEVPKRVGRLGHVPVLAKAR